MRIYANFHSPSALALVVLFSFAFEMDTFVHGLGRICTLLSPMFMMAILFFSSRCVCERERERITQAMLYIDMRTLIEQSERERQGEREKKANVFFVHLHERITSDLFRCSFRDGYGHDRSNASRLSGTESRAFSPRLSV